MMESNVNNPLAHTIEKNKCIKFVDTMFLVLSSISIAIIVSIPKNTNTKDTIANQSPNVNAKSNISSFLLVWG